MAIIWLSVRHYIQKLPEWYYYGGVRKLYEFDSNPYDLNVTDTDASSGYSFALSSNGRRFAIGVPSLDTGMVLV